MLTVTIVVSCLIIAIPFAISEIKLRRELKVTQKVHQLVMVRDIDGLDALLKSKEAKYLQEHDRFTYSEHVRIIRNYNQIIEAICPPKK